MSVSLAEGSEDEDEVVGVCLGFFGFGCSDSEEEVLPLEGLGGGLDLSLRLALNLSRALLGVDEELFLWLLLCPLLLLPALLPLLPLPALLCLLP